MFLLLCLKSLKHKTQNILTQTHYPNGDKLKEKVVNRNWTIVQVYSNRHFCHIELMTYFGLYPWVQIRRTSDLSIHLGTQYFAFLKPQIIHLLDRNQIISHSVNTS